MAGRRRRSGSLPLPDHELGRGDPWTGRLPDGLVTGTAAHAPAVLTVLIETAARWEHVRRDHLVPLLARRPELVLRAEAAALITLAGYADLPLLEALTAELPDRHVELDSGIAALSKKLTDFALVRSDDEATKARLYERLAARLSNVAVSRFSFEMADPKHLGHLLATLRKIDGVFDVYRVTSGV